MAQKIQLSADLEIRQKTHTMMVVFVCLILSLFSALFFIPNTSGQFTPVSLIFELNGDQEIAGSEVEMRIFASAREPVNAFDIVLNYPSENLEIVRVSTAGSIVSIWQSLPSADDGSGILRFVGGMLSPFSGERGEIAAMVFRVKKASGDIVFAAKKADFALADGEGTPVYAVIEHRKNKVAVRPQPVASTPRIVETAVVQDPNAQNPIVTAKASDEGAVREMRLRSREWLLWSEWQKTRLPAAVPKYAWSVQLAAISWDGGESRKTIYRFDVAALKFLLTLAAFSVLCYAGRTIFKLWKKKRRKI